MKNDAIYKKRTDIPCGVSVLFILHLKNFIPQSQGIQTIFM